MELGLNGRVALLTASSQGIGLAVAQELAREGAKLLLTSRSEGHLAEAATSLRALGVEVETLAADVTQPASCRAMVERCVERFGRLDILFANSGGPPEGSAMTVSDDEIRHAMDLNLLSVMHLSRAAVPVMREAGWGRIIALTSLSVKQPIDSLALSNTTRAGVQGFLKSLAGEVGVDGITVNNVLPGYTATERLNHLAEHLAGDGEDAAAVRDRWAASIPLGRIARPEEVAALVAFVASERASYLHGTAIAVDGGAVRSLL